MQFVCYIGVYDNREECSLYQLRVTLLRGVVVRRLVM